MANGEVHDDVADQYLSQFDRTIGVSAMQKIRKFSFLQELGFNGQLAFMKETFYGLREFNQQIGGMYSSTHQVLQDAWATIRGIAPKNPQVESQLFTSSVLGKVGKLFRSIHGFNKAFAASPEELKDPGKIEERAGLF